MTYDLYLLSENQTCNCIVVIDTDCICQSSKKLVMLVLPFPGKTKKNIVFEKKSKLNTEFILFKVEYAPSIK